MKKRKLIHLFIIYSNRIDPELLTCTILKMTANPQIIDQTTNETIKLITKQPFIVSYGIACIRKNTSYEVLMIKKRATYAFLDLLRGRYDPNRPYELKHMFNEMTINEKVLIKTKDFATLWMYSLGRIPMKNSEKTMFSKSSKKFNTLCEREGGEMLDLLINNSTHGELLWEILRDD